MYKNVKSLIAKYAQRTRFNLSAKNSLLFIGYYKYLYKPKPGSLNAFISEYSLSKRNFLNVIQIGANDGITHDPIHKFIKRDNWKGVLLEPQFYVYDRYLKVIYQKNKGIHTLCAALGEKDDKQYLYKIGFSNMRWATGLASFVRENVEKALSSAYVQAQCARYNIEIPPLSEQITSEEVIIISPQTLLNQYNILTIDFLQIDVEGYDYEVIKIFNIHESQPKVIVFEHTHLSEQDRQSCSEHLKENNYAIRRFGANTLAMLKPLSSFSKYFANEEVVHNAG